MLLEPIFNFKLVYRKVASSNMSCFEAHAGLGGFHLHLLVFPFVYQFNSKIVALVYSSFAND